MPKYPTRASMVARPTMLEMAVCTPKLAWAVEGTGLWVEVLAG